MDRYQKVEKPKAESPINENEIRITSQGLVRNYISYATSLLQTGKEIVLKAMGQAISKTVAIAEIIKRRVPRLHQDTAISSESITDVWEPIEEGLLPVEQTRHVSMISITLSTRELNKDSPGYQAPSTDQGRSQYNYQQQQQQQPPRQTRAVYNAGNEDSYGRGRGRGRGRGQGWNRGGYSNYQEIGGYSNTGRGGRMGGYGGRSGGYGGRSGGYGGRGGGYGGRGGGYGGRDGGYGGQGDGGYASQGGGGYGGQNAGYGGQNAGYGGQNGGYGGQNGGYGGENGDGYGYRGTGYGRGGGRRGGSGRGYGGRGRGRMGSLPRGGGDQA